MDELCTIAETGATYKHYESVGRAAKPCEGHEDREADLMKSLAQGLYTHCHAWCLYDYASGAELAWLWRNNNLCWDLLSGGACFSDNIGELEEIQARISAICTVSPTSSPTVARRMAFRLSPTNSSTSTPTNCEPHYTWSEERAIELCPSYLAHGQADKSFGVSVCSDTTSITKQGSLEESLANQFFTSCSSFCVYDYETLINNVRTGSYDHGGFVWKHDDACWAWVTAYDCFTISYYEYETVMLFAGIKCATQ